MSSPLGSNMRSNHKRNNYVTMLSVYPQYNRKWLER